MSLNNDFDVSSYKKVNERIIEFREKYPDGIITTFRTQVQDGVSFKAVVCRDLKEAEIFATTGLSVATGHSFLANSARREDKVEEYSETVSVGRALAFLGFGAEKSIASAEEMSLFHKNRKANREEEDLSHLPKLKSTKLIDTSKLKAFKTKE